MKAHVILSGCGVYDGSEIQESVLALLALQQFGFEYQCWAPNMPQHHVINHLTGEEMPEVRNVLTETARIARGQVMDLADFSAENCDLLLLPGGFGAAKNLSDWAFLGAQGTIHPMVAKAIQHVHALGKPIVALCMAPVLLAHALGNLQPNISLGQDGNESPYDIASIHEGAEFLGAKTAEVPAGEIWVDANLKLICGPCYMMNTNISEVYTTIMKSVEQAKSWL
jgi:enhancing lycopene biosynthesis protein 2